MRKTKILIWIVLSVFFITQIAVAQKAAPVKQDKQQANEKSIEDKTVKNVPFMPKMTITTDLNKVSPFKKIIDEPEGEEEKEVEKKEHIAEEVEEEKKEEAKEQEEVKEEEKEGKEAEEQKEGTLPYFPEPYDPKKEEVEPEEIEIIPLPKDEEPEGGHIGLPLPKEPEEYVIVLPEPKDNGEIPIDPPTPEEPIVIEINLEDLKTETRFKDNGAVDCVISYDENGNAVTYEKFVYNADGVLYQSLNYAGGDDSGRLRLRRRYNPEGNVTSIMQFNESAVIETTFNDDGLPATKITVWTHVNAAAHEEYIYDEDGNIIDTIVKRYEAGQNEYTVIYDRNGIAQYIIKNGVIPIDPPSPKRPEDVIIIDPVPEEDPKSQIPEDPSQMPMPTYQEMEYDEAGNLSRITVFEGKDNTGRIINVTDFNKDGTIIHIKNYDVSGHVVSITTFEGNNSTDRIRTVVVNNKDGTIKDITKYDASGRVLSITTFEDDDSLRYIRKVVEFNEDGAVKSITHYAPNGDVIVPKEPEEPKEGTLPYIPGPYDPLEEVEEPEEIGIVPLPEEPKEGTLPYIPGPYDPLEEVEEPEEIGIVPLPEEPKEVPIIIPEPDLPEEKYEEIPLKKEEITAQIKRLREERDQMRQVIKEMFKEIKTLRSERKSLDRKKDKEAREELKKQIEEKRKALQEKQAERKRIADNLREWKARLRKFKKVELPKPIIDDPVMGYPEDPLSQLDGIEI
jgi:hypothetical protein